MRACGQTVCFQVQCQCSQEKPQQLPRKTISNQFYDKAAANLQIQLKKQRESYARDSEDLNSQLFQLKNTILRLELRNQKDLQAERELRRQYNALFQKLKEKEPVVINKVEVIEKIKEIPVQIENEVLESQIAHLKGTNNDFRIQIQRLRAEKDMLSLQNQNLKGQLEKLNKQITNLKQKNQNTSRIVGEKDQHILKLNLQIQYLKSNKQVIVQTKHLFPEFRQEEKVRTQTKIETIYAQKPVEKLVFVDVVRKVKQFIQPQKAVVNRIISCEEKNQCDCEQNQSKLEFYKNQVHHFSNLVERLENNIASYKSERQNLVNIIDGKNSQLNCLQTKMKLFGETGLSRYPNGGSTVNVQVNRVKQQKANTRNVSTNHQKATAKK